MKKTYTTFFLNLHLRTRDTNDRRMIIKYTTCESQETLLLSYDDNENLWNRRSQTDRRRCSTALLRFPNKKPPPAVGKTYFDSLNKHQIGTVVRMFENKLSRIPSSDLHK